MRRAKVVMGLALVVVCGIGSFVYGQTGINAQDYLNADGTVNQARIQADISNGKDPAELVTQLINADPSHAALFTGAVVTAAPTQAAHITTAAVTAAPDQAASITAAAVRAAPTRAGTIRAAAIHVVQDSPSVPRGAAMADIIKEINAAVAAVLKEIGLTMTETAADGGDIEGLSKE